MKIAFGGAELVSSGLEIRGSSKLSEAGLGVPHCTQNLSGMTILQFGQLILMSMRDLDRALVALFVGAALGVWELLLSNRKLEEKDLEAPQPPPEGRDT